MRSASGQGRTRQDNRHGAAASISIGQDGILQSASQKPRHLAAGMRHMIGALNMQCRLVEVTQHEAASSASGYASSAATKTENEQRTRKANQQHSKEGEKIEKMCVVSAAPVASMQGVHGLPLMTLPCCLMEAADCVPFSLLGCPSDAVRGSSRAWTAPLREVAIAMTAWPMGQSINATSGHVHQAQHFRATALLRVVVRRYRLVALIHATVQLLLNPLYVDLVG
jgi:hypothetical protein